MALHLLDYMISREKTNYILDADIKGFFDHIDHEWLIRMVESRIKELQNLEGNLVFIVSKDFIGLKCRRACCII